MSPSEKKKRAATVSVVSNTTLVLLKITAGLISGSVSILSEAIHSGMDLLAAGIALFAVREASKPPDSAHKFGHGKFENLSGAIEALLIFGAALWIVTEAVHKLAAPQPLEFIGWGIGVMAVSTVVNILVSRMLFRVGTETDSMALIADAWHLRTDVYTSAGIMFALGAYAAVRAVFPSADIHWIDPVTAIVVALFITKAAYDLTVSSTRVLLDESLPDEDEKAIEAKLLAVKDRYISYKNFRTRKAGAVRFVELDAIVEAGMSVKAAHDVADVITAGIKEKFPDTMVTVHIEPCGGECPDECRIHCSIFPNGTA